MAAPERTPVHREYEYDHSSRMEGRRNVERSYGVRRPSNTSYMEQQENFYYWPPGSIIPSLSPSTPESGTPEPLSTAPPDTPTTRDKQPPPVRQLLLTESDESFVSVEDALRKILRAQNELKQQMNGIMIRVQNIEQQKTVEVVGSSLSSSSTGASNEKRKRLPSKLSGKIGALYQELPAEKQFNFEEKCNSAWNLEVKKSLKEKLMLDKENTFSSSTITVSIKRYFESRKRILRESRPDQKERVSSQEKQRKRRSRRHCLFERRKKHVQSDELEWWNQLSIEYMSLESSDEEDDISIVHHISWRSKKLEEYLKMLDARADAAVQSSKHHFAQRKLRIDGAVAETTPPVSAPTWTISRDWRRQHGRLMRGLSESGEHSDIDSESDCEQLAFEY
ncbi:uncharacterized protein C14orf93 homolog [Dysidea avara]|uniref:uncharacterized protein C14orf93 homolog n=1 Tax=Dysidea avara TaxID=196820 RepID=UPI0033251114